MGARKRVLEHVVAAGLGDVYGAAVQYPIQEELILAGSEARDGRS